MTRTITLAEYRALLADVAERYGGVVYRNDAVWHYDAARMWVLARLELTPTPDGSLMAFAELRCGQSVALSRDPARALLDLDAARIVLLAAIAARDELAGVVVDVSDRSPA